VLILHFRATMDAYGGAEEVHPWPKPLGSARDVPHASHGTGAAAMSGDFQAWPRDHFFVIPWTGRSAVASFGVS
jgi:hypothetical protein